MKKHICIIFILSLFISSNRIVAQGADKNNDENIEYIILTAEKSSSFKVKDKIIRVTTPQDYYTESPSIFFRYKSSKVKGAVELDFVHRIYNAERFREKRAQEGKADTIYQHEVMAIRKIPRAEISKLQPFDLDKAIKEMAKEELDELLRSWQGRKLAIIDRSDPTGELISVYEVNIADDIGSHWWVISASSIQKRRPHPQLILPDSTKNQNIKGNLHMLINNLGVVLNYYKLGYPSDNSHSRETVNVVYDGKSLSVREFNDLKNIPQDSVKILGVKIDYLLYGKTKISIETKR